MIEHAGYILAYLEEHWPVTIVTVGVLGSLIVWVKQQLVDNVFATKRELRATKEALELKMEGHEKADLHRYVELTKTMADNHDEIKTLLIKMPMAKTGS